MPDYNSAQISFLGRYLKDQLVKYISNFFEIDQAEFWGLNLSLNFHVAHSDLPIGLEEIRYFAKQRFGQSAIYDGVATDIPVVDVLMGELGRVPTAIFINAAKWNYFDLEKQKTAENTGLNVPTLNIVSESQSAMAEYLNRREHYTVLYGVEERPIGERKLYGIYNQPRANIVLSSQNFYNLPTENLYTIFLDLIHQFIESSLVSSSKQIEIKIPERLMRKMAEPYNQVSGVTLYEMITGDKVGYGISRITSARENEGANLLEHKVRDDSQYDRIIFKTTTPCLQRSFYARNTLPIFQINSLTWEQVSFSATTGVFCPRLNRLMYVDFKNS